MCSNKKISCLSFLFLKFMEIFLKFMKILQLNVSDYSKLKLDLNKIKEISKNSNIQFKILRISNVLVCKKLQSKL